MQQTWRVVIAANSPSWANLAVHALEPTGLTVVTLPTSQELFKTHDRDPSVYIVETGSDMALLAQLVYHIRSNCGDLQTTCIICVASSEAIKGSPAIGFWLINGSAAIDAYLSHEGVTDLAAVVRRAIASTFPDE